MCSGCPCPLPLALISATRCGLPVQGCRFCRARSNRLNPASHSAGLHCFIRPHTQTAVHIPAAGVSISIPSFVSMTPLLVSAWIAVSRVIDRWHNTDDVAIGSFVGIFAGVMAWRHYVALRVAGHAPSTGESRAQQLRYLSCSACVAYISQCMRTSASSRCNPTAELLPSLVAFPFADALVYAISVAVARRRCHCNRRRCPLRAGGASARAYARLVERLVGQRTQQQWQQPWHSRSDTRKASHGTCCSSRGGSSARLSVVGPGYGPTAAAGAAACSHRPATTDTPRGACSIGISSSDSSGSGISGSAGSALSRRASVDSTGA